jgi:glucokinase
MALETAGRAPGFPARSETVIAGIDLGGTQVRIAFASDDGQITNTSRTRTALLTGPRAMVRWVRDQVKRRGQVRGVGIGAPGPVDPRRGILINPPNLQGWHNTPLAAMISAALDCPAHLENDANLAGLGEFHQGAGQGSRDMVYITWSTGVGGGLVVNRELFSGAHGSAGEIGHMILKPGGPLCGCGQHGCLEALVSGANVAKRYGESAAEILHEAAHGEEEAQAIVREIAGYMGLALINLANLLDPELIVIGGGFTRSWNQLQPPMMAVLKASPFIKARRRPKVRRARLGDRAGSVGAVEWARTWLERDQSEV